MDNLSLKTNSSSDHLIEEQPSTSKASTSHTVVHVGEAHRDSLVNRPKILVQPPQDSAEEETPGPSGLSYPNHVGNNCHKPNCHQKGIPSFSEEIFEPNSNEFDFESIEAMVNYRGPGVTDV